MPKVSIIVPTYNRADYLKKSLESILKQEYTDFEIIVSDNLSTDNTAEVVRAIGDPRIYYHCNDSNIGMARNYNMALDLARGEYIQFFSDDDIMLPGCLTNNVKILDTYLSVGLVHSDILTIDSNDKVISNVHWATLAWKRWYRIHDKSKVFDKRQYHAYLFNIHNIICMPTVMIRKSVLTYTGLVDPNLKFIIDWDLWLKITLFSDVYYINKKLVSYRVHDKSTTNETGFLMQEELKYVKKNISTRFQEKIICKSSRYKSFLQTHFFYADYSYIRISKIIIKRLLGYLG